MSARARLESAALTAALIAVAAFAVSFVGGLGDAPSPYAPAAGGTLRSTAEAPAAGPAPGARERERLLSLEPRIRVEVLNAAGLPGIARAATERLRDRGFDVVYFGNAPDFGRDTSVVLARTTDVEAARAVAAALGIEVVRSEPDAARVLEASVVLGTDWPSAARGGGAGWRDRIGRLLRGAFGLAER